MTWQTTYPAVADVMLAGFTTLAQWDDQLPPPQTDVERTVRSRIVRQMQTVAVEELRRSDPKLAVLYQSVIDRAAKLGIHASTSRGS